MNVLHAVVERKTKEQEMHYTREPGYTTENEHHCVPMMTVYLPERFRQVGLNSRRHSIRWQKGS